MLQQETPEDFVFATGESHSVREFLEEAFSYLDLDWREYVEIAPRYFQPLEVEDLRGDASRARERLGWQPRVTFKELVRLMVDADLKAILKVRQCHDVIQKMAQSAGIEAAREPRKREIP